MAVLEYQASVQSIGCGLEESPLAAIAKTA